MPENVAHAPLDELRRSIEEAEASGARAARTMTLATSGPNGAHARTVVARVIGVDGVRFHSSSPSLKTSDLLVEARCSAVFFWPVLGRQVVLTGNACESSRDVAGEVYASLSRDLQKLAWTHYELADHPGPSMEEIAQTFAALREDSRVTTPPPSWAAFDLVPRRIDFWQAGTHDAPPERARFERQGNLWHRFAMLP